MLIETYQFHQHHLAIYFYTAELRHYFSIA